VSAHPRYACLRVCLLRLLAAIALVLPAPPAAGQQETTQPEQLPREFVDLLLGRTVYDPIAPAYLLRQLPRPLPGADEFGAEGRVIGTVAWRNRSTSAIAVARDLEDARERFERLAREAGWTERPAPPERRGFVPARSSDPLRGFCHLPDNASLQVQTHRGPADSSYVVLDYRPARGGAFCDPEIARQRREAPDRYAADMPSLRPPEGLHVMGSGWSGSDDESSTNALVLGATAPADLVTHFASQLREQGWTLIDRLAGDRAGFLSAEKADGAVTLAMTVLVRRTDDEQHRLEMWVVRGR